ncbi:helix-turn-helix domain-containing protein [Salmonella enterica]|uniref:helix-turn-helix domain-containing protein n=1 Tax=Salmonella enterica TaxID=28901 RepID=UPI003D2FE1AF
MLSRKGIPLSNYMQTFSRLSRSMILKILAQLKIGGFIEMENGKLIRINKNYQKILTVFYVLSSLPDLCCIGIQNETAR